MTVRKNSARRFAAALLVPLLTACAACGGGGGDGVGDVIKKFPVDSSGEVLARKNVSTDSGISRDGNGSLRIDVTGTQTLTLYRLGGIDLENAFLVYRAHIRTEDLQGETFLEMRCFFQSKGEFFSRNYQTALSGTNDWTVRSTPFKLRPGENPDVVELGIHVSGRGTVWIDGIELLKRPLE
jgi:hypothetical protein